MSYVPVVSARMGFHSQCNLVWVAYLLDPGFNCLLVGAAKSAQIFKTLHGALRVRPD
jgi:hypothetical protein